MAKRNIAAKRVVENAIPHIGNEVIIIAPGCNGHGFFATSLPTKTSADMEKLITMTNEALKKLRSWQRNRRREEDRQRKIDEEEV